MALSFIRSLIDGIEAELVVLGRNCPRKTVTTKISLQGGDVQVSCLRGEFSSGVLRRFSAARGCSILDLLISKTAVSLSRPVVVAS